jgi:prevent-host-death family protein
MTQTITLKELRPELPKVVESIDKKMDRFVVTRHGKPVVVMLSMEDYMCLMETLDILADRETMIRVKKGLEEMRRGKTRSWQELKRSLEKL